MYKLTVCPKTFTNITLDHPTCNKKMYGITFHFYNKEEKMLTHELFTLDFVIWDDDNKEFFSRKLTNISLLEQCKKRLIEGKYIEWKD